MNVLNQTNQGDEEQKLVETTETSTTQEKKGIVKKTVNKVAGLSAAILIATAPIGEAKAQEVYDFSGKSKEEISAMLKELPFNEFKKYMDEYGVTIENFDPNKKIHIARVRNLLTYEIYEKDLDKRANEVTDDLHKTMNNLTK